MSVLFSYINPRVLRHMPDWPHAYLSLIATYSNTYTTRTCVSYQTVFSQLKNTDVTIKSITWWDRMLNYSLKKKKENRKFVLVYLVGRVFVNGLGDLGSIPGRVIPKIFKMVLGTSLLNTQQYKARIEGKAIQRNEQRPPQHFGVVAIEKGAFWSPRLRSPTFLTYRINPFKTTGW